MVKSVIDLAANFGLRVIAEGVETPEQEMHLQRLGCARAQGYYYSKPIPVSQFDKTFLQLSRV